MEAGADGYLVKPFGPDVLTKRVEAMLNPKPKVEAVVEPAKPSFDLD